MKAYLFMSTAFFLLAGVVCLVLVVIIVASAIKAIAEMIKPKKYTADDFAKAFEKSLKKYNKKIEKQERVVKKNGK